MQSEHDVWWFAANLAYHLVDWTLKLLGFFVVMLGAYIAFITFGGLGLALIVIIVAVWRLTKDIARIRAGQDEPDRSPFDFHKHD